MEILRHKTTVVSRAASTVIIPSLISGWANTCHLFLPQFANSRPEVMKCRFPSAGLTSGSCGNRCELALCSTLCLVPRELAAMCWRQGMLTLGLLAFLLKILSAVCLPTRTPLGFPQSLAPDVDVSDTRGPSTRLSL